MLDAAGANEPTEHCCVHLWVHLVYRGGPSNCGCERPKSRLCTGLNLQDNTQGHTKESNTIWKYKTHNPSADQGDTSLSNVLILGLSYLYVKFCVLP